MNTGCVPKRPEGCLDKWPLDSDSFARVCPDVEANTRDGRR